MENRGLGEEFFHGNRHGQRGRVMGMGRNRAEASFITLQGAFSIVEDVSVVYCLAKGKAVGFDCLLCSEVRLCGHDGKMPR